jgi:hypothetical protein
MNAFDVTDARRLSDILNVFSDLDDIRWSQPVNYNLVNYCRTDLTPDERLLTHYLCYIMDRQTAFARVWDVGGYVVSHLVHEYARSRGLDVWSGILVNYVKWADNGIELQAPVLTPNQRLQRRGIQGMSVQFSSRYMPEDLLLMFRTLVILDAVANRSLSRFIVHAIDCSQDMHEAIENMASAFEQLTYTASGAKSAGDFDAALVQVQASAGSFSLKQHASFPRYQRKRLWCSLRDYLKSPEFNADFVAALQDIGYPHHREFDRREPALRCECQSKMHPL